MDKKINWWLDGGFDSDFQNILNRNTVLGNTSPTSLVLAAQNRFYTNTKSVIQSMSIFYVLGNGLGAENYKLLNWGENSNTFNADYPTSITHSAAGVKGNGIDQYISTNWNASTNGGLKYTLNSASRGAWIYTLGLSQTIDGTMATSGRNSMRNQSSLSVHKINQGGNNLAGALDFSGTGYVSINRTDSTNVSGYNDLTKTDTTATSVSLHNEEQVIFKTGATFGNPVLSMYFCGPSLTEAQHNLLRNNFAAYLTEIGV